MLLRLTNGVQTVTLSGDGALLRGCTYVPRTPALHEQETRSTLRDGGDITAITRRNVTESARVVLQGQASALLTQVRALEAFFPVHDAQRHPAAGRVFVEFRLEDRGDVYRSEVLAGRVEWPDVPIGPRLASQAVEIVVIWTRRDYWEGPEVALPLSSNATSTTTSPVSFGNGATNSNWFQVSVAHSELAGWLPAPLRLKITNEEAGDVFIRNLYLTNTAHVGTLSLFRRGNQNELAHGATYSTGSSDNNLAYIWLLPNAMLSALAGRYVRVLVAFNSGFDGYIQSGARLGTTTDIYRNEQIRGDGSYLVDAGTLPLPPSRLMPNPTSTALALWIQKAGGISTTLNYVQLTPVGEHVFRRLYNIGAVPPGASIVDNGIDDTVYGEFASGTAPSVYSYHTPLHIWPGRVNRLRALYNTTTGLGASNQMSAQAWVRPRRLTV